MVLTVQELADVKKAAEWLEKVEEEREKRKELALKELTQLQRSINLKKLIAVHLTNYFPEEGIIRPFGISTKLSINDSRKVYFPRETIHFSLNGPVGSHLYGNWDGVKYGIIIPLEDIFKRVYHFAPQDTFVLGQLRLPRSAEILGRNKDLIGKDVGAAKVVLVGEEENIFHAVQQKIKEKGYPLMNIAMWDWGETIDQEAARAANEALGRKGSITLRDVTEWLSKKTGSHDVSLFGRIEEIATVMYKYMYQCKNNKELLSLHDDGKWIKNFKERCLEVIEELKQLIEKKEQLGYGSLWNSSEQDELSALKRIIHLLELLYKEIDLLIIRTKQTAEVDEALERLNEKEKKWLIREYYLLKKFEEIVGTQNTKKAERMLVKVAQVEKRVYQRYRQLRSELEKLRKNDWFVGDINDIEKALDYAEGELAVTLSYHSGKLRELIEQNKWKEVDMLVDKMENRISGIEETLERLTEILKARKDHFTA